MKNMELLELELDCARLLEILCRTLRTVCIVGNVISRQIVH
jgi:hypothetical protein